MSSRTTNPKVKAIKLKNMKTKSPKITKIDTKVSTSTPKKPQLLEDAVKHYSAQDVSMEERLHDLIDKKGALCSNSRKPTFETRRNIKTQFFAMMKLVTDAICTLQADGKHLVDIFSDFITYYDVHLTVSPKRAQRGTGAVRKALGNYRHSQSISRQQPEYVMFDVCMWVKYLLQEACVLEANGIQLRHAMTVQ